MRLDRACGDSVRRWCDPAFEAADCDFRWNSSAYYFSADGLVEAMLWEAEPRRFALRYPDSGVIEAWGEDSWPPPCIDYWVYVDPLARTAELSVEGWGERAATLRMSGDGDADGRLRATRFAELLLVTPPADPES